MKYSHLALLLLLSGPVAAQQSPPPVLELDAIQRLVDQNDFRMALQEVNQRLEAQPDEVESQFLKGLLLQQTGDINGAREIFVSLARRYPQLPAIYNNLAALYTSTGEYELARQSLQSAIANNPEYPVAQANLGDLYVKMAVEAYQQALRLQPGDDASRAKLKLLESLFAGGR